MFADFNSHIRILSVLSLSWGETDVTVKGRLIYALSFRLSGNACIREGDREVRLSDGDVLYMPAGADYHLHSGRESILAVHFEVEGTAEKRMERYRPRDVAAFHRSFSRLLEVWNSKAPGSYHRALSLLYGMIADLEESGEGTVSADYERIRPAVDHMHARFTDPELTVRQLCARAFVSDTYFRRLFVSVYGETPRHYLNRLRVEHAGALLREWNHTVSEVAHLSGFSDAKYFSTVFRQYMGCSPSQYRVGDCFIKRGRFF